MSELTGPDYMHLLAQQAAERGQPFAREFATMVQACFATPTELVGEFVAQRPLHADEASPVSIVIGAARAAAAASDSESFDEVLNVGLALLAKWPEYLVP